jgi:hypothetical protein
MHERLASAAVAVRCRWQAGKIGREHVNDRGVLRLQALRFAPQELPVSVRTEIRLYH